MTGFMTFASGVIVGLITGALIVIGISVFMPDEGEDGK